MCENTLPHNSSRRPNKDLGSHDIQHHRYNDLSSEGKMVCCLENKKNASTGWKYRNLVIIFLVKIKVL